MRYLVATLLAALAFPAGALAQDLSITTREVPLRPSRSTAAARPPVFNLVGVQWQGGGSVSFRTHAPGGRWSPWRAAAPEAEDLPDPQSAEHRTGAWRIGNPWWVGSADAIQYRRHGVVSRLRASFVFSPVRAIPLRILSIAGSPAIVPRAAWRANEAITKAPTYADSLRYAVVHHTAGTNSYTAAESAAIVRGIQLYHVRSNGWNDIGYNFLVDKYGQVFEGRAGGVERAVIGAHAGGFNTGSVGVAVLGNYAGGGISSAALAAIEKLLAWRLDLAHVDPLSSLSSLSNGNERFAAGTPVPLRAISGHRDTGFTDCPGNGLYRQLPTIARATAELGLPKLYDALAKGRPGTVVRFSARLSQPAAWTVTVTDDAGKVVAVGRGEGTAVDWTWDATLAAASRYTYTIDAGPSFRPATGVLGQRPAALAVTGATAKPKTFTPNGDSVADATTITYSLSIPASVTATLRDAAGQTLATLFTEQRRAGRQTFRFSAAGVPDGRYGVVLVATAADGKIARADVPIVVDRTLAAFAAQPAVFSPNGDRRVDATSFTFVLAAPAHVDVRVVGGPKVFAGDLPAGPQTLPFGARLRDGRHAAVIAATGPYGVRSQTARFTVDTKRPRLRILSAAALRFWVSEASTVLVTLDGRRTQVEVKAGGFVVAGATASRISAVAYDLAGNRSAAARYP